MRSKRVGPVGLERDSAKSMIGNKAPGQRGTHCVEVLRAMRRFTDQHDGSPPGARRELIECRLAIDGLAARAPSAAKRCSIAVSNAEKNWTAGMRVGALPSPALSPFGGEGAERMRRG
jgi:hypothetical protein